MLSNHITTLQANICMVVFFYVSTMFALQFQLQLVLFKDYSLGVHSMWDEMLRVHVASLKSYSGASLKYLIKIF